MIKETIAIIGNGNMGQAIAKGLLRKKIIRRKQLLVTDSSTKNNREVVEKATVVILAIKPQVSRVVLWEIKGVVQNKLVISVMAGISIDTIQQVLGQACAVVRVMPNLAAKVGMSLSVWVASTQVNRTQKEMVVAILETIGVQLQLEREERINAATAISGSGPAYFFYLTELLETGAMQFGFSQKQATLLAKQTLLGSAELLRVSAGSAEELRHAVTSKGGTTEAAIEIFEKAKLQGIIQKGIFAAFKRAKQLGSEKI